MNKEPKKRHIFKILFVLLLLYIFVSPFLEPYPSMAVIVDSALSLTLFVSVYAVQRQQKYRTIGMVLLVPLQVLYWFGIYEVIPFSREGSYLFLMVYYYLLIHSFVVQLFQFKKVNSNVLFGTLCLYLIIGMFWGALYALLNEIIPGSYAGAMVSNGGEEALHVFNYFSMVTLTTLGYGDITPQTVGAGALCQMEAIVGQFFMTVVVAWTVAIVVSTRNVE
jgi:voltage-gated potassium channel